MYIVTFCKNSLFQFYRILGPFLMILCFYLCTPPGYYFFKIMTSWLILTSFCDFFDFLGPWAQGPMGPGPMGLWAHGPPNEKFKLFFPEAFFAFSGNEKSKLLRDARNAENSRNPPAPRPNPHLGRDKPVVETSHWDISLKVSGPKK